MTQKLLSLLFILIFTITNLNAQANEEEDRIQRIDYGGMTMDVPKEWDFRIFPMGSGNYGFFSDKNPEMFFLAFSLDENSSNEILSELLTDGGQSMLKGIGMKVSTKAEATRFNSIDADEYILTGAEDKADFSGRILTMADRGRHFMLIYYASESVSNDFDFIRMLASFDIDGTWTEEGNEDEDEMSEMQPLEFVETEDGYLVYDQEGVSFEFPTTWIIQEDSYSPRSKSYALSCEVSDTLTFMFMMSENEIMPDEYINNIPKEHSDIKYKTNKPVQKKLAGFKTKEYEFEIPSESDLPPMKGRMIFFKDEAHYFYIFYGEKGANKENQDIKRLLNSLKITPYKIDLSN